MSEKIDLRELEHLFALVDESEMRFTSCLARALDIRFLDEEALACVSFLNKLKLCCGLAIFSCTIGKKFLQTFEAALSQAEAAWQSWQSAQQSGAKFLRTCSTDSFISPDLYRSAHALRAATEELLTLLEGRRQAR